MTLLICFVLFNFFKPELFLELPIDGIETVCDMESIELLEPLRNPEYIPIVKKIQNKKKKKQTTKR